MTSHADSPNEFDQAHRLLPFLDSFLSEHNPHGNCRVKLARDGSMHLLIAGGRGGSFEWTEHRPANRAAVAFCTGWVGPRSNLQQISARQLAKQSQQARLLASRLERLFQGRVPVLLQFRNRNPQRLQWGVRLFNNLCPGVLRREHSRYFDYLLVGLEDDSGAILLRFRSPRYEMVLAVTLDPRGKGRLVQQWNELQLKILEDSRPSAQRRMREHRVEDFLAYLLSRNLPPRRSWQFEFDDPPPGYRPPDKDVDFLHIRRLDDSAFFEMLFATPTDVAVVASCDRECLNLFSLAATPRESWTTISAWQSVPSPGYLEHCCHVGLDTCATITGEDSLEDCLRQLAARQPAPQVAVVFDSCLHRLIGVDVGQRLEKLRQELSLPLIFYDIRTTQHPYLKQWRDFWSQAMQSLAPAAGDKDQVEASGIALLGFGGDGGEISLDMQQLDLEVTCRLFPQFSVRDLQALPCSRLLVMNKWEYCRVIFQDLLAMQEQPRITLPLPYGPKGSVEWLRVIWRAVNPRAQFTLPPAIRDRQQRVLEECRRLQGLRVGLFARSWAARQTLSARLRYGLPLVRFFHELGLSLDVNLFVAGHEQQPDTGELAAALGLALDSGDSLTFFEDGRQMHELLQRGDFPMVYTERFRDNRILAAGKAPLHLHGLRPGLSGSLATVRLVHGLVSSNFYSRYHGSLGNSREPILP